ncbi:MAG TPA: DUF4124 domain-containing protein [Steroidobacteraceae bacterium]|nr:DUF4124 domain-containing protein [Steroidobacteraceae bacterium]
MLRSALLTFPKLGLLSIACCTLFAAQAYADVYKYKDEKGNVLYTDKPQYLPAERLSIKTDNTNIVDLDQRNEDEAAAQAQRDATRKDAKDSAADKKKSKQSVSEGKADSCNKAREDYRQRMAAQRVYEEGPKGERRYLTDKELEASRASAKQAMDALCN